MNVDHCKYENIHESYHSLGVNAYDKQATLKLWNDKFNDDSDCHLTMSAIITLFNARYQSSADYQRIHLKHNV